MEAYEDRVRRGGDEALRELDPFFAGTGVVHQTLRRIVKTLAELRVRHAVTGAMALNAHGYRRATIDVDIAVLTEDFGGLQEKLLAHGYGSVPNKKRSIRDTATMVRIDVFPCQNLSVQSVDGVDYQTLAQLLETKLSIGLAGPGYIKHLGDVVETIKVLRLPLDFATLLREDVRRKFEEFWHALRASPDVEFLSQIPEEP
jgi:hypothetical protein